MIAPSDPRSEGECSMRSLRLLGLVAIVVSLGFHAGCRPPAETATKDSKGAAASGEKKLRVAVIPKGTTHVFWKSVHFGAQKAADELGVEVEFRGPPKESDRDQQISVVQSFVSKGIDAICLAPLDSQALVRPVREADRAGIPTVIFDSGLDDAKLTVSYVATDNREGGRLAARALAKAINEQGNVIMLRYTQGSESTMQREEGFLEAIAEFPNVKVLSSDQYAGTSMESALNKAQQLLNRYGDQVNGVFAVCESNAEGVLRALEDMQLDGKVKFVGFDPSERLCTALSEGRVSALVLQDPVNMGYQAVKAAVAKVRGEPIEPRVDTGVYVATKENQETEPLKTLLNPPTM